MFHLVPSLYDQKYNNKQFEIICSYIDYLITLGHSLSEYLANIRKIDSRKIITLFHYVDCRYYSPIDIRITKAPTVIVMGNMMRNYESLVKIVHNVPDTTFFICQGHQNLYDYFKNERNVRLIPFVSENELKLLMNKADISLNVMYDTIGSNVIVTSMAMGLAMICSDVGSIRDYCGPDNAIFCSNNNLHEFSDAVKLLCENINLLVSMKQQSVYRAQKLSISNFHKKLQTRLTDIVNNK